MRITDQIELDERFLEERFARGSGPGGQNVNKVETAVELRVDVGAWPIADDIKERLKHLAGRRLTADGILHIESSEHRTQGQNREAARARLVELLRRAARRPIHRRPTKPGAAARETRLMAKHRRSDVKRRRRARPGSDDQ